MPSLLVLIADNLLYQLHSFHIRVGIFLFWNTESTKYQTEAWNNLLTTLLLLLNYLPELSLKPFQQRLAESENLITALLLTPFLEAPSRQAWELPCSRGKVRAFSFLREVSWVHPDFRLSLWADFEKSYVLWDLGKQYIYLSFISIYCRFFYHGE